ncbi:hypothetical protein GCM10023238_36350 [Streptomyces heliomycini]
MVSRFTAVLFVFAAILFYSAYKILKGEEDSFDPGKSVAVRLLRKVVPVRDAYAGPHFFVREAADASPPRCSPSSPRSRAADLVFAVDSVPAVLAVSNDAFIVYTSNAFAILGLRALYFMLAGLLDRFHYLSKGLALILAFIGVKLILQASHKLISPAVPEIPSPLSLAVIAVILSASVALSLLRPPPAGHEHAPPAAGTGPARRPCRGPVTGPDHRRNPFKGPPGRVEGRVMFGCVRNGRAVGGAPDRARAPLVQAPRERRPGTTQDDGRPRPRVDRRPLPQREVHRLRTRTGAGRLRARRDPADAGRPAARPDPKDGRGDRDSTTSARTRGRGAAPTRAGTAPLPLRGGVSA